MDSIVGFTLFHRLRASDVEAARAVQRRVLAPFHHLSAKTLEIGQTRLEFWGRGDLASRLHRLSNGSLLVLAGSPHGRKTWPDCLAGQGLEQLGDAELPWNGRVLLLEISPDGRTWKMRNDWAGSIPVFHAQVNQGRIAGTIESVVAAATSPSVSDLNLPGLVSLLVNGHTLCDWTLSTHVRVVPPDSDMKWDDGGFRATRLFTVRPTTALYEESWHDLIDQMHTGQRKAIEESFSASPSWIVPLSAGLDSRLLASVAAELGVAVRTYAWGSEDTVDVVYSREIARTLRLPWAHIDLGSDYLVRYTSQWMEWFGTTVHAHGMYQMAFLDAISKTGDAPVATGFLGDVLSSSPLLLEENLPRGHIYDQWHTHWKADELRSLLRVPVDDALDTVTAEMDALKETIEGTRYKKGMLAEIWSRQRLFTSFQSSLSDYWRGTATPFLNHEYARFCFGLPRAALGQKQLLNAVYRRHYPRIAAIPGTYGPEPMLITGRYLLKRRLAATLPPALLRGPLQGFRDVPPRMDIECVQAHGWRALWPIPEARGLLDEWLDTAKLDAAYDVVMSSKADMRPLRQLQSVQTFAWWLMQQHGTFPGPTA